jgi:hypothetical protein
VSRIHQRKKRGKIHLLTIQGREESREDEGSRERESSHHHSGNFARRLQLLAPSPRSLRCPLVPARRDTAETETATATVSPGSASHSPRLENVTTADLPPLPLAPRRPRRVGGGGRGEQEAATATRSFVSMRQRQGCFSLLSPSSASCGHAAHGAPLTCGAYPL